MDAYGRFGKAEWTDLPSVKTGVCIHCGNPFFLGIKRNAGSRLYCSRSCQIKSSNMKSRKKESYQEKKRIYMREYMRKTREAKSDISSNQGGEDRLARKQEKEKESP